MVSGQKRKPDKPTKTKNVVIRHVPFNKKEVVTRVEVSRKVKKRIVTKSTKIVVPIVKSLPNPQPPPLPSEQDSPPAPTKKTRKGPSRSVSSNLEQWLQYREEFADEFMRHEALYLGTKPSPCQTCGANNTLFRCLNCFSSNPLCQHCIVHQHVHSILHRLQKWNGSFFNEMSLFELGVSHQLGHDVSNPCPLPSDPIPLTLFDISGIHTIRITYCYCHSDEAEPPPRCCQLLRACWFPATWTRPGTAFTFRLLDFLHRLQTQSKVNLYDFYISLISVTNVAGQKPPVYRYNEKSLALRIWVHLRQVRRGGGFHTCDGFDALASGSLCVECPACPHPEKNLVSLHIDSWCNTLYLSMDANFKLKQKERGFNDPPLSNGLAYMVSNTRLQDHLTQCASKGLTTEINTCGSSFNAVSQAYTKYAKGYAVTGVGGVDCARHGFKRPNGVVDLQRGERYSNMDLALVSTLAPSLTAGISRVLVSYDIACQWHKNLQARLDSYTTLPPLRVSDLSYWKVVVPKFHLSGHGNECQVLFNLAYTKWAGRMDGERIEGGWAQTTSMATWTRESGPNARRGILDDHWNASNWQKVLGLGKFLGKNLQRSLAWSKSQRAVANLVSGSYPAETVSEWRKMCEDFDRDPSKPNPYEEVDNHMTMAKLRFELVREEGKKTSGDLPKVPASAFFRKALDIEDRLRVLAAKAKTKVTTVHRHAEILELKNTISRNLADFRQAQRIHMPGLTPIFDETHDDEATEDSIKLWLPSELSAGEREALYLPDIPILEFRFRYAQADDSLAEIRRLRRLGQSLLDQNTKHPSLVQKSVTRTQGLFEGFQGRIRRCASRYSHARDAMLALDPDEKLSPRWTERFQKLNDSDIHGPGRGLDDRSEGQFVPSWIWMVQHSSPPAPTPLSGPIAAIGPAPSPNARMTATPESTTTNDPEATNSMRVHWAKCQARAERYEEEVSLTVEEMGRTLRYFEWKKNWWLSLQSKRAKSTNHPPGDVQRGLHAYACRQADVYDTLITSFATRWRKLLTSHRPSPSWLARYPGTTNSAPLQPSHSHSRSGIRSTTDLANNKSTSMDCEPPHPPSSPDGDLDEPLTNGMEGDGDDDDGDGDYAVDEAELFYVDD